MILHSHKQVKQRILRQLSQTHPQFSSLSMQHPHIIKSSSLKSIYKVIQTTQPTMQQFKQSLQNIRQIQKQFSSSSNNRTINIKLLLAVPAYEESLSKVHRLLTKTEQFFTTCINILEYNQKIRQKYEVVMINSQQEKETGLKEIKQLISAIRQTVNNQSSFLQFLYSSKGKRIFGLQTKQQLIKNKNPYSKSSNQDTGSISPQKTTFPSSSSNLFSLVNNSLSSTSQIKQIYLLSPPDQYAYSVTKITQQDQYLIYHQETLQKLLIYVNTINKINRELLGVCGVSNNNFAMNNNAISSNNLGSNGNNSTSFSNSNDINLINNLQQTLKQLTYQQIFLVQNNKLNQLLNYILISNKSIHSQIQKNSHTLLYYKNLLKDQSIKVYYLLFMAPREVQIIKDYAAGVLKGNTEMFQKFQSKKIEKIQQNSLNQEESVKDFRKSLFKQLDDLELLKGKVQQIASYVYSAGHKINSRNTINTQNNSLNFSTSTSIFSTLYQQNVRKFYLFTIQTKGFLLQAKKLNSYLISYYSQQQTSIRNLSQDNTMNKQIKIGQTQISNNKNDNSGEIVRLNKMARDFFTDQQNILNQIQKLQEQHIQYNINPISQPLTHNNSGSPYNHSSNQQIAYKKVIKLLKQLQKIQLNFSSIKNKLSVLYQNRTNQYNKYDFKTQNNNQEYEFIARFRENIIEIKQEIRGMDKRLVLMIKQLKNMQNGKNNINGVDNNVNSQNKGYLRTIKHNYNKEPNVVEKDSIKIINNKTINNKNYDNELFSQLSQSRIYSQKSSIYNALTKNLTVDDVLLPSIENFTMNDEKLQQQIKMSEQELIQTCNKFINEQILMKQQDIVFQLEDNKNFDVKRIKELLYLVDRIIARYKQNGNIEVVMANSKKVQEKPLIQPILTSELNNKNASNSSKTPSKNKQNQKPQKSSSKSPSKNKKVAHTTANIQKIGPQSSITQNIPKTQSVPLSQPPYQILLTLKQNLSLILQVMLTQISQSCIHKIFDYKSIHFEIFSVLLQRLISYKNRLFSQQFSSRLQKSIPNLRKIIQKRKYFVDKIIKTCQDVREIFNFIISFLSPQQKTIKYQSIDQNTYETILKVLLAIKQVQALRRGNNDYRYANSNNVQQQGASLLLEQQIYRPFIRLFNNILKIVGKYHNLEYQQQKRGQSNQYKEDKILSKQVNNILDNVRSCIDLKTEIIAWIQEASNKIKKNKIGSQFQQREWKLQNIHQEIQQFVQRYNQLKQYPIIKYTKLKNIAKILKRSLKLSKQSTTSNTNAANNYENSKRKLIQVLQFIKQNVEQIII